MMSLTAHTRDCRQREVAPARGERAAIRRHTRKRFGLAHRAGAGFTLIEAVASMVILTLLLSGIMVVFHRTTDAVRAQRMRERAASVAQRRMELVIRSLQISRGGVTSGIDELDPLIHWQLTLESERMGTYAERGIGVVIKATVTAGSSMPADDQTEVKLVRYLGFIKPELEDMGILEFLEEKPPWLDELEEELGREPTLDEVLDKMFEVGDLPQVLADELGIDVGPEEPEGEQPDEPAEDAKDEPRDKN